MSVDVVSEIELEASVREVSIYAADPDNAPNWHESVEAVEWLTAPPVDHGSKFRFIAHALGRRLESTYEVVEYKKGRRMVMRTEEGPFPAEITYVWEKLPGDRTRMTMRNRGEPRGFSKLMAPLMRGQMKKANEADLRALKALFEGTGG
jgi:uncharacterized membrane protein